MKRNLPAKNTKGTKKKNDSFFVYSFISCFSRANFPAAYRTIFAIAAFLFLGAATCAAQTKNLTAQILGKNTTAERQSLLEKRSEAELKQLVDDLIKESETKTDSKESGEILEIARTTAEKINYKIGLANVLYRLGAINLDKNSPQTISAFFESALKLMEEAGDQRQLAKMLDSMGYIRVRIGDYGNALENYNRALKIYEELGEKQSAAQNLDATGAIYMYRGEYNQAEAAHRQALAISEKLSWKEGVANSLFHLGIINRFRGNYVDALRLYQESKEIGDTLADKKPDIYPSATVLRHIAGTYFLQGNLRLALDYANQSLTLDERRKDEMGTAYSLQMTALIRVAEKNFTAALPIAEKTVPMFEKIGDNDGLARSRAVVGNIYLSIGEYDKALESLDKALKMREASNSRDGMATARIGIARVFLAQKKYADALALADKAAASAKENGNRELLWQAQSLTGQIYLAQNECGKTREAFDAAIGTIESLRGEIVGGASENSLFFAERTKPYQMLAAMLFKENDFAESFEYVERAKARVLLDAARFGRNQPPAVLTDAEHAQENRLRGDVSSLNAQLSKIGAADKEKSAELKQKLEAARTALARFQTNLYALHPELRIKRGAVKPLEVSEVGNLLDEKSALLEYLVADDAILLFVFTKQNNIVEFKTYRIAADRDGIGADISRFRQMLADRNVLFADASRKLYDALLRPAAAQLAGKTNLTIVPDEGLWELPFQALQSAENHYVLDDASVAYAPSITILREMRGGRNKTDFKNIIAFGNPFAKEAKILKTEFAALPEAERQTAAIEKLYGANNAAIFIRTKADESTFKQATATNFSILHLATHGVLDNKSPLNSYILLAPNPATGDDGKLEAWEILEMNLSADLVFLSACETARGQSRSGEGLIGLSWSLMVAGARNVVVSQWKVESASTTSLTVEFYKNLKQNGNANKPEALRQAALKLRRNPTTAHPFYWAGFVLIGEGN